MSRLVADLLSLSRIELNEHIPPSGRVDVARAAADVVDAISVLSQEKGVTVLLDIPSGEARITGDRDEILQVIQNLTDNAIKYSPVGGMVELTVRADLDAEAASASRLPGATRLSLLTPDRDTAARYVAVAVRDYGPGMAREHLPRLTERFYRVEGQKSGDRPGTGLGLAIVKHIVNRHRGGLTVESTPGEGTTLVAYFPHPAAGSGARGRRGGRDPGDGGGHGGVVHGCSFLLSYFSERVMRPVKLVPMPSRRRCSQSSW
jgi:two-component system phosphate regulon sensor histidine kinase PhoR